jgi:crotonobetainyl-CoA:carnitine CoA-transferase CaiB-like acyl-CoA transferase
MTAGHSGVFDGLRVLDLSSEVAGPYCAKVFGDYGADVIKIEPPGGEFGRTLAPFFDSVAAPESSAFFAFLNLNKRGIVLDLESDSSRDVFLDLVRGADVVIESFKPGYMPSLGLGYDDLEAIRPGLVMTSITPYGQTSLWSEREGNDLTANALGMWANINEVEGMTPLKSAGYNASFVGGIAAYLATVAAVDGRDAHGVGQYIDVSIVEAISALVAPMFYSAQTQGPRRWRSGGGERLTHVKDGYMSLTLGLTRFLDQAWLELGLPDLDEGRRMWEQGQRGELMQRVGQAAASREKYELFFKLLELQCPAGMALTTADLFSDPHLRERGFWVEVDQPGVGKVEMPATSFLMSETPFAVTRPAPQLGQHTEEVLAKMLNYDPARISALRREGAIA